jgi:hypothetical protein
MDRANSIAKLALKIVILIILLAALVWVGTCAYANIVERLGDNSPKMPSLEKARYTVTVRSIGETYLTNKYTRLSDTQVILHGYWEIKDNKYRYHDIDLPLDEYYFGDIVIERRVQ